MDVHTWLGARSTVLVRKLPALEAMDLSLWEGGVLVRLRAGGQDVGLKFRERHDGASYGTTQSMSVALDLPAGTTLVSEAGQVIETLMGLLERVDDGTWEIPRLEPEEPDGGPGAGERHTKDVPGEAAEVSPPRNAEMFGYACVTDQTAMLQQWHEPPAALVVLVGDRWVGDRPLDGAVAHAEEGAATGTVVVDAREATAAAASAVVEAARAAGAGWVWLLGGHEVTGAHTLQTWPETPGAGGYTAVRLDQLGGQALGGIQAWAASGGGVVLLAAQGDGVDPLTLDALVATLVGGSVLAAGLPHCQLPAVARTAIPSALLGVAGDGTLHTEVCGYCDRAPACPGVPRATFEAWGMRGLTPQFD